MVRVFYFISLLLLSIPVNAINTDSLWAVIKGQGEDSIKAKAYNELGIAISSTDLDSSIKIYDAGIELAKRIQGKKTEAALLTNKGFSYYFKGDIDKSEVLITEGIEIYEELGLSKNISYCYFTLGTFRANRQEFTKAKVLLEKAYNYGIDLKGNEEVMSRICNNLGLIYGYLEQRAQSVDFKIKAIKYKESVNDPYLGGSVMNLSLDYFNSGDYKNSLEQLIKAYELLKTDTTVQKAICLQMMVQNYIELNDTINAKTWLKELDNYVTTLNDSVYFALSTLERAKLLTKTKRFEYANKFYEKALSQLPERETIRTKAQININYAINLAEIFHAQASPDKSIVPRIMDQAQSALDLSLETGALKDQLMSIELLKDFSEIVGDYPAAIKYSKEYIALDDSIFNKEKELIAGDLKYKYETEKKELEIELLNKDNTLKEQELAESAQAQKRQFYVILAVLVVLLLSLTVVTLLFKQAKRRKRTNAQLLEQNTIIEKQKEQVEQALFEITKRDEEKELLLKEIHHRVKNNLQVVSSLLELQSRKEGETAQSAFADGQSRVRAMALIHEKLYRNDDIANIDFTEYTQQLVDQISSLYASKTAKIDIDAKDFRFDIDTAVPLGLILNELITNAYKYAFSEASGQLSISVEPKGDLGYELVVKDNGQGMPENFDFDKARSLGLRLVKRLSKQLYGNAAYNNHNGAEFKVLFKDTIQRKEVA